MPYQAGKALYNRLSQFYCLEKGVIPLQTACASFRINIESQT